MSSSKDPRNEPEEIDDDPRDIEDREDYRAALEYQQQHPVPTDRQSFVQRIGLTPLLAGAATVIAIGVALFNHANTRDGIAPDFAPNAAATADPSGFNVSDYWHGTPSNTSHPLIFHILIAQKPAAPNEPQRPGTVMGTMRLPCQGDGSTRIEYGTWDEGHLVLRVTETGSGKPLSIDVKRNGERLEGSITQDTYNGHIVLERGEIACPGR